MAASRVRPQLRFAELVIFSLFIDLGYMYHASCTLLRVHSCRNHGHPGSSHLLAQSAHFAHVLLFDDPDEGNRSRNHRLDDLPFSPRQIK